MVNTGLAGHANAHANADTDAVWAVLREVPDPEIPVVSICDLGIVREVRVGEGRDDRLEVVITPTYAGCPAMHVIEESVRGALRAHGYDDARVTTTLSPAWTTDWITPQGRAQLKAYGIAPPGAARTGAQVVRFDTPRHRAAGQPPACPQCGSAHTELLSQFGSTACKALYRCNDCREPFDYFKPY
jgi:ring-1,2-phenylacetyl-CoA epoxidase subunit PaaD